MLGVEVSIAVIAAIVGFIVVSALWPARKPKPSHQRGDEGSTAQAQESSAPWYMTLDVPAGASEDEIRDAYKRMMAKYHPDKVAQLGPELQRVATEMSARINLAYQQAMKAKHR